MNIKYFWAVVIVLVLSLSLFSCVEECTHVDADDDYLCDECGEHYDDGDENEVPDATTLSVTISVKLDDGSAAAGVKFTLTRGDKVYNLTSGADGKATVELEIGAYYVDYDYDSLPEYCTPDTFGFKIEEGTTSVTLNVRDNTPDGSMAKPFFVSETETEITLAPGQEIYYSIHVSSVRYISVFNAAALLSHNGESFEAVEGVAYLTIEPDQMGVANAVFSVKNTSEGEFTAIMEVAAALGSMENPIELTDNTATISVSSEDLIYYSWTSDKDGVLILASPTYRNSVSLTNVLPGDLVVSSQTAGGNVAYLPVKAGDSITLGISAMAPTAEESKQNPDLATTPIDVEIALTVYAGTAAEPVPVLKNYIDISLGVGESVVFSATAGQVVRVSDDSSVSVTHGDSVLTNENGGVIEVELVDPTFTLTNNADHLNGIAIEFSNN